MPIFWGYCRISKKDQSKYSLENQEILQKKYCPDGYELRIRKEEQSGRNFGSRLVLDQILSDCQKGDTVSFIDNSRFGRSTRENIEVADLLRDKQVKFLVGNSEVTHDAIGKYRFHMESAASEFLSNLQAEKSLAGMITAKEKGEWLYSSRLWGYEHTKKGVQIVESEAEVLRELFERYANHDSLNSITRDLNQRGKRNRKGTPLIVSTLSKMLDNPVYMGYSLPQGVKVPDRATLVKSEIYQPPIIEPELWWRCWDLRRSHVRPHGIQYEYRWGHYPLGGMIKCPRCGKSYVHNHKRSRGKIYDLYVLGLHSSCPNKTSAVSTRLAEDVMRTIYIFHVLFAKEITKEKTAEILKGVAERRKDIAQQRRNRDIAKKKMGTLLAKLDFVVGNQLAEQLLKEELSQTERDYSASEAAILRFESEIANLEVEERGLLARYKTDSAAKAMSNKFSELKAQFAQMFTAITLDNKQLVAQADGFSWVCHLPIGAKVLPDSLELRCYKEGKLRQRYEVAYKEDEIASLTPERAMADLAERVVGAKSTKKGNSNE